MQATATLKRQLASKGQACDHIRSDTWGVIQHILQEDGVAGFWKGERWEGTLQGVGASGRPHQQNCLGPRVTQCMASCSVCAAHQAA